MHWKVPTYRPFTQLRPGLSFSVLLQEGHFMHGAINSFLNFGREIQSLITGLWPTDHRSTGVPITGTPVTDHQSTVDYGLTDRLLTTLYDVPFTMYSVLTSKEILFPLKPKNPV